MALIQKAVIYAKLPFIFHRFVKSERLPREQLKKHQEAQLRKLVGYAYHNVPYHNKLFKQTGINPSNIRTLEDLEKIPVTTKDDLRKLPVSEYTACNIPVNSRVINKTSGSTGQPFEVHRDIFAVVIFNIAIYSNYYTRGLQPSDRIISLGPNWLVRGHILQKFGFLTTEGLSPVKTPEELVTEMLRFKPSVIVAYPSWLELVCKELVAKNIQYNGIRKVFAGGESVQSHTRKICKEALGVEPYESYGSSELGLVGFECEERAGLHVAEQCLIPEILHQGKDSRPGELGTFTSTHLYNYAMPLIRYNTGDIGTYVEGECLCGRTTARIKLFGGRESAILTLANGRLIPGITLIGDVHEVHGVKQFTIVQEKPDMFVLYLVPEKGFNEESVEEIKTRFRRKLGDVTVEVRRVEGIPLEKSGKFQAVISKVPVRV